MSTRHASVRGHRGILLGCLVLCLLALAGAAQAGWVYESGVAGQVENTALLTNPNLYHYGWGLDFIQKTGYPYSNNWVHFTIPTKATTKVSQIYLRYWTSGITSVLGQVDVWNGDTKVQVFPPPKTNAWSSSSYPYVVKDLTLTLKSPQVFTKGICVSVNTRGYGDPDVRTHQFKFHTFGINEV